MKIQMRFIWAIWLACWACIVYTCQLRCDELAPDSLYTPGFPPLGVYSVPGACSSIHDPSQVASVRLREGERIMDAYDRLFAIADHGRGGIIFLPWDVSIEQCDGFSMVGRLDKGMPGGITLSGVVGPQGQLPAMRCRLENRGGTVPQGTEGSGIGIHFDLHHIRSPEWGAGYGRALVENVELDGFAKGIVTSYAHTVVRNSYIHHQPDNGISSSNKKRFYPRAEPAGYESDVTFEACGNEISHSGQGNVRHAAYMHRHQITDRYTEHQLWVDNLMHSCGYSSCLKSTANKNTVINNRFYSSLVTDPYYDQMASGMLVDLAACAHNEIRDNLFEVRRDSPRGQKQVVGIRNRRNEMVGCDTPQGYARKGAPATKFYAYGYWDESYWADLRGNIVFPTIITNNRFVFSGTNADTLTAIQMSGTLPVAVEKSFGPSCIQDAPEGWYERSRVFATGNIFVNSSPERRYETAPESHDERCVHPPPAEIPAVPESMIEVQ